MSADLAPYLNQIIHSDSLELLPSLPANSIDLVFADPPYNLQLKQDLWRPDNSEVDPVDDDWDQFDGFREYDTFTNNWLKQVKRVMKPDATIWVSGTYHNIFRVGAIMQNLGFWLLNTVAWMKYNAMPNFRGRRLKNDVEVIIWAKYNEKSRYQFNYNLMKRFNDFGEGKQLGSVWKVNRVMANERILGLNGEKLHSTQKPAELLKRVILASSLPDDIVLDPFSGTGTTASVAHQLRRQFIAIEQDKLYYDASVRRLSTVKVLPKNHELIQAVYTEKPPRIAFKKLLAAGYVREGQTLYFDDPDTEAIITDNAKLRMGETIGTIHSLARDLKAVRSINGWKHWFYLDETGKRQSINRLRYEYADNLT